MHQPNKSNQELLMVRCLALLRRSCRTTLALRVGRQSMTALEPALKPQQQGVRR